MSDAQSLAPAKSRWVRAIVPGVITLALVAAAILLAPGVMNFSGVEIEPHAPNMALLGAAPPAIQLHLLAAVAAFFLGLMQFALPKGTGMHRTLGWIWVLLIAAAAISSLFIRQLNHGAFSLIHILSGWTLVVLPMAIYAARRGDIARHRGRMTGLFIGGLLIAGTLAFMPGRLMWRLFLGD